jgi:hypothetical protein
MAKARLSALLSEYPGTRALRRGEIDSATVAFDFAAPKVLYEEFRPLIRGERYDVAARRFLAGARDIFGVAAAILMHALGRQFQHAVGQRGQEMPVVARRTASCPRIPTAPRSASPWWPCRDGWSARPAPGSSADRTASRHHQPRLLAARQHPALLLDIVAGEAEAARQRPQASPARPAGTNPPATPHGALAVQQLHRVLGEVAHLDAGAERHLPCVGRPRRPPASAASTCPRR